MMTIFSKDCILLIVFEEKILLFNNKKANQSISPYIDCKKIHIIFDLLRFYTLQRRAHVFIKADALGVIISQIRQITS